MTKRNAEAMPERDRPAFQITPAMARAGYEAILEWHEGDDSREEGAQAVFRAMLRAGGFHVSEQFVEPGIYTTEVSKAQGLNGKLKAGSLYPVGKHVLAAPTHGPFSVENRPAYLRGLSQSDVERVEVLVGSLLPDTLP